MLTGRLASQSGYSKTHPLLLDFNPTLASVLQAAGYDTAAIVDNPNVAASLGYAKGFARYRETWEEKGLASEMDRTRAITADAVALPRRRRRPERPFLLWLHYVNPHAPYEPPAALRHAAFLDAEAARGPVLRAGGRLPRRRPEAVGARRDARSAGTWPSTTARSPPWTPRSAGCSRRSTPRRCGTARSCVLTSDHGESLGEHDYYFDHGENLFDPSMRVPLLARGPWRSRPGAAPGCSRRRSTSSRRCSTRSRSRIRPISQA